MSEITPQQITELHESRKKHRTNIALLAVWTIAVGTIAWTGGATQEKLTYQAAVIEAMNLRRVEDAAMYGLVDRAKAETVATCVALGGKNCDKPIQ